MRVSDQMSAFVVSYRYHCLYKLFKTSFNGWQCQLSTQCSQRFKLEPIKVAKNARIRRFLTHTLMLLTISGSFKLGFRFSRRPPFATHHHPLPLPPFSYHHPPNTPVSHLMVENVNRFANVLLMQMYNDASLTDTEHTYAIRSVLIFNSRCVQFLSLSRSLPPLPSPRSLCHSWFLFFVCSFCVKLLAKFC